jgi:hypothetical protein
MIRELKGISSVESWMELVSALSRVIRSIWPIVSAGMESFIRDFPRGNEIVDLLHP